MRPRLRTPLEPFKEETYECGEPAVGSSWVRFDIRFYTVALVFLVFDVEVAFLYPWALVFGDLRDSGMGLFVFVEALLFLIILGVGFAYCWVKGDLDWVKATKMRQDLGSKQGAEKQKAPGGSSVASGSRLPGASTNPVSRDKGDLPGEGAVASN